MHFLSHFLVDILHVNGLLHVFKWLSHVSTVCCINFFFMFFYTSISCFQITDACSACFEQRTVFTQQVLAKALRQMVCVCHL
jgi:hypothetical protein